MRFNQLCNKCAKQLQITFLTNDKHAITNFSFRITLDGSSKKTVTIRANIVHQRLQVLNFEDRSSEEPCINFGPVYYGTDRIEAAWVYNDGPERVKWVAVLNEGVAGEEAVSLLA